MFVTSKTSVNKTKIVPSRLARLELVFTDVYHRARDSKTGFTHTPDSPKNRIYIVCVEKPIFQHGRFTALGQQTGARTKFEWFVPKTGLRF